MRRYLRSFLTREALGQFTRMAGIGVVNTVVDFGLLNIFFAIFGWGEIVSVTVAFVLATLVAYILNRRFTFGLPARVHLRETLTFVGVNLVALGVTDAIVWWASRRMGGLSVLELNITKLITTAIILLPKFAGYRDLVFSDAVERRKNLNSN